MSDPGRGLYRVSWNRSIPSGCIAVANPTNVPIVVGSATATGWDRVGRTAPILVGSTFDSGGNNVPENVNVLVICP